MSARLSREARSYLQRIWGVDDIAAIDPAIACDLLENAHADPAHALDRECWNAYAAAHGLPPWDRIRPQAFCALATTRPITPTPRSHP